MLLPVTSLDFELPPLPKGVSISQVYTDFIRYLYHRTRDYFIDSTPDGRNIWTRLESKIIIVFGISSAWYDLKQNFLRRCALRAGIMPTDEIHTRVEFITEEEAYYHYRLAECMAWDINPDFPFLLDFPFRIPFTFTELKIVFLLILSIFVSSLSLVIPLTSYGDS
jgi:hypothetical protein